MSFASPFLPPPARPAFAPTSYAAAASEDRCAPRFEVALPASLRLAAGRGFQTVIKDISISGFCASAIIRMPTGAKCWLTLPGLEGLQAEVVWWNQNLVGGAFTNLLSPIVLDHLLARFQRAAA